ncbi:MAG: hypothetical protein WKF96_06330 [Solirubrobacteraceae bacterium]
MGLNIIYTEVVMPTRELPAQAPDFTLDHVLGHSVSLADFRGRTVAVIFGGKESAPQIREGVGIIRRRFDPDELPVVGVSDLRDAPRAVRVIVKNQLKKAFEEALRDEAKSIEAAGKPPRADPKKDVNMLLDWKGETVDAFGLTGVENEAVGVLVDGDGRILGSGSGAQLGPEILALMPA